MNVKLVAAGSAVMLALSGAGAAAAGAGTAAPKQAPGVEAVGSVFDAALAYLDIGKQALAQDLMHGQSLAQIAVAQGKTADGLVDAVVAAAQTQLDTAAAAHKIDGAKEQALLTKLRTSLAQLVTRNVPAAKQGATQRLRPVTMFLQPLLAYLKLHLVTLPNAGPIVQPRGTVTSKLDNGTSLGASLATGILGRLKLKLDASVTAGRLTPAQAAAFLAKLKAATAALSGGGSS